MCVKSPEGGKLIEEDLPMGRQKLRPGLTMPKPTGSKWKNMMGAKDSVTENNKQLIEEAVQNVRRELQRQKEMGCRESNKMYFVREVGNKHSYQARAMKAKRKRQKAVAGDGELCPKTTRECLESARGEEWKKSIDKEYFGLIDMGAIIPDLTWQGAMKLSHSPQS